MESVDDPELPYATFTEPPKELADVWEALAGAIFQDSGFSNDITWAVIAPLLAPGGSISDWPKNPVQTIHRKFGKAMEFV